MATPLSVVLTELLQNAVDHAFRNGQPPRQRRGRCWRTTTTSCTVKVVDDGIGVPDDFSLDQTTASACRSCARS